MLSIEVISSTIIGVLIAFAITRLVWLLDKRRRKKALLQSIQLELKGIKALLAGELNPLPTQEWESAMSSGQLTVLNLKERKMINETARALLMPTVYVEKCLCKPFHILNLE